MRCYLKTSYVRYNQRDIYVKNIYINPLQSN